MSARVFFISACCLGLLIVPWARLAAQSDSMDTNIRVFRAAGVVRDVDLKGRTITISHQAISNFMGAMTMPFQVKNIADITGLHRGDKVAFQLHVTQTDSWVDHLVRNGTVPVSENQLPGSGTAPAKSSLIHSRNALWYYKFTNELGQAVSLSDFHGQALGITFIYTRCPLPNYCPRLSGNFREASQKLESMPSAPTNWHFLSVSFDPKFDTPEVLRAYAESYQYDSNHWSFITGPPDKIAELARDSGVVYASDNALIKHNFRTLIVDRNGHLQTVFPMSGDFSDSIVSEMIKAAAVTNQPGAR